MSSICATMYYYFMYNRLTFMEHYHMRSNVESAFSMIKGKLVTWLDPKSDTGQINEALCKVLCHNICVLIQAIHALNVEPIFRQPLKRGSSGLFGTSSHSL